MTPLFKMIYRDQGRKPQKRTFKDNANVVKEMNALNGEILAFDVSAINEYAVSLYRSLSEAEREEIVFQPLPATGVWLEQSGIATLLLPGSSEEMLKVRFITKNASEFMDSSTLHGACFRVALTMIYMINTPRLVSYSHISTPRRVKSAATPSGWMTNPHTKVRLCIDDEEISINPVGKHTGKRPHHYVRGHFRRYWIQGKRELKWIAPHWKGDKSIGTVTREYECYSNAEAEA